MRRNKLISPEKPIQAPVDYRFKLLFLPTLSYAIAIAILISFIGTVFFVFQVKPITLGIINSVFLSVCLLTVATPLSFILAKIADLILTSFGISGLNLWCRRTHIDWQDITLIKPYQVLGLRCLFIKTVKGKNIQFATRWYQIAQILDRVRELAGSEHILVRALEKELSRPRYELTKLWIGVISSIALTMSIYLIDGNMYAAEQEKPLQQAIATYVSQHPQMPPNQSAIELQALMTKLGLSINVFGDGSEAKVKSTTAAIDDWKTIEVPLSTFITKQLDKTEDSLEPIPDKILTYLKKHQTDLEAIETHLATNPIPAWGTDGWIAQTNPKAENSPLFSQVTNILNIIHLENLTIANILNWQQQPTADFPKNLVTLEKLQQSIQSQQSLMGQLTRTIGESRMSKLVRQIDSPQAKLNARLPKGWGDNLFSSKRHADMLMAIEYESMVTNKFLLNPDLFDRLLVNYESPLQFIPKISYLIQPRLRLAAVDRHREISKGLAYWRKQNICHSDGQSGLRSPLDVDDFSMSLTLLTSQYAKVNKEDLLWELTAGVRQIKTKLAAGKNVDLIAKEFNLPSQVCQGEKWTAKATDRSINISFSHPPDWNALGMSNSSKNDLLTYTIKSIDRG